MEPEDADESTHGSSDADEIERLMADCLAAEAADPEGAIDKLCIEHPREAEEIRRRYHALSALGMGGGVLGALAFGPGYRLGEFELVERLGEGGMGVVYRAREIALQRDVALKLVRPEQSIFAGTLSRFRREIETIARLKHRGIVPVYAVGEEAGVPYFTMELIDGGTLAAVLERLRGRTPESLTGIDIDKNLAGGLDAQDSAFGVTWVDACLAIVEQLAEALQHAHDHGVLHRDVKPSNVALSHDGRAMLLDFGLTVSSGDERLTRTGSQVGTLEYMSPEQLRGDRDLDARTDVYALGATLFELLTLQRPFSTDGDESELRLAILSGEAIGGTSVRARNRRVSVEAETVCLKALATHRADRYASAADFARDCRNLLEHRPIEARPPSLGITAVRWIQRHPTRALALVLLFVLVAVVPGASWLSGQLEMEKTRAAERETKSAMKELELRYEELRRLSDNKLAGELLVEEEELWPAVPERLEAFDAWLEGAAQLVGRKSLHAESLANLTARIGSRASETESDMDLDLGDEWHLSLLSELLVGLEEVEARVAGVTERKSFAHAVVELTVEGEDARAAWLMAAEQVDASPLYEGVVLAPQLGLLPLAINPKSGLLECWLPESGARPEYNSDGRIESTPETAIVFVLLPGGTFSMGSRAPSDQHPFGSDNVDPMHGQGFTLDEGPVTEVGLAPFFISKFETTQAQWKRLFGKNPSSIRARTPDGEVDEWTSLILPVETVDWWTVSRAASRLGLILPTEAQWEYATRGGTTTPFWFGGNETDFAYRGNVGSAEYMVSGRTPGASWYDGYAETAPVGSYLPNAFGLHDTLGNVGEWCRETMVSYEFPAEGPEGIRRGPDDGNRVLRGGDFELPWYLARCAARQGASVSFQQAGAGIRFARRLNP